MSTPPGKTSEGAEETPKERIDRELSELLNGLRVLLPGVQVLLAFLLSVPFSSRFADVNGFQRTVYYVTLIAAALAVAMLGTPAAQHRVLFRAKEKEGMLRRSNRYALLGSVAVAVSVSAGTLLIVDFVFDSVLAWVSASVFLGVMSWAWFIEPALHRGKEV
jgi:hypothetical protein